MIRQIIIAMLSLALRIFFRRIEVHGLERVPLQSPAIFVVNHPNGLVDPVFVLCLAPRRVSFLAKAPLFRTPVLGFFIRALDSLPAYRRQDEGEDTSRNRETFERCRALLKSGGTIAICPEGISHDKPNLQPIKTGTARIALGAAAADRTLGLKIVPAGLYYTSKVMFRSAALLYFGEPLEVEPVALDADGEPPREAVRALSNRIEYALRQITLNAEHEHLLSTIALAETLFSLEEHDPHDEPSLTRELESRRRFVEGYSFHRARSPERLATLEARIRDFEEKLKRAGIEPQYLSLVPSSRRASLSYVVRRALLLLLLSPLALGGALVHYPAYRLSGFFAIRLSKNEDDVVSTIKILAAILFFPLTWIFLAILSFTLLSWPMAALATILAPVAGYISILYFEELDRFIRRIKAFSFFITQRQSFEHLSAERLDIRREILALREEVFGESREENSVGKI